MHRARILFSILTLAFTAALRAGTASDEMAQSASHFLNALTPEQKSKATFEFKADERKNWHFIPRERKGLPVKEMTSAQRALFHALLSSGLSSRGFSKAATIMSLEQVLHDIEQGKGFTRDPELYFASVFGTPDASHGTWGWRVEGHHLSLNFTIVDGQLIAATPSFMGTNPAEVRDGPRKGLRVLAREEDLARELLASLDEGQKKAAIISNEAPKDILTMAERSVKPLEQKGLSAAKMKKSQTAILERLIREYVERNRPEMSSEDMEKIKKAGFDKIQFAWMGSVNRGEGHYYRVQGPTFLLEYDNTQNGANHIHAVWRDFEHDFGDDLLLKHYQESHRK